MPRDVASRNAKAVCDEGRGVGESGLGVYLDFAAAIARLGENVIRDRYGNLFEMYERITGDDPYQLPMRIYPAIHYTMGGLWVDYNLMSTIPGLFVIGEANFSDHGANRLGASALMQGLSDGYFILPYTIGNYIAQTKLEKVDSNHPEVRGAETQVDCQTKRLLAIKGKRTVDSFHRELGKLVWDYCGMSRTAAGLDFAVGKIRELREEYWRNVNVLGSADELNQSLEKAGRVARLLRIGGADVHRCAAAQRELRRPLPRGIPDARRRGAAQRRPVFVCGGLGVCGRGQGAVPAQGAADFRVRSSQPAELQVDETDPAYLAAEEPVVAGQDGPL